MRNYEIDKTVIVECQGSYHIWLLGCMRSATQIRKMWFKSSMFHAVELSEKTLNKLLVLEIYAASMDNDNTEVKSKLLKYQNQVVF